MFPIILAKELDKEYYLKKWDIQFVRPGRRRAEGIWRRTQEKATREKSGWTGPGDARRRMIHFLDQYDMVETDDGTLNFAITETYLWMSITLPESECKHYDDKIIKQLEKYGWQQTSELTYRKEELTFKIQRYKVHPEDSKVHRNIPKNYRTIEYCIVTDGMSLEERVIHSPWSILNSGIRQQGSRVENPNISKDINIIKNYVPVQVELAGGASIDLGIPPLNHLHTTYNVTNPHDKSFVFGHDDHFLTEFIADPVAFYEKAGTAYKTCILSEPNEFYNLLKSLYDSGYAVGDVITNNFDGLPSLVGLQEKYIRRYDEPKHFPRINFHKDAKSLLVIGNHADRRKVQKQARERGMKVIYVDPEMYVDYFGNPVHYPLEDIRAEDILFHTTAVEFAANAKTVLGL